jgi:hypothetical protein
LERVAGGGGAADGIAAPLGDRRVTAGASVVENASYVVNASSTLARAAAAWEAAMKEQWMRTEEVARESEPRMEMNIATLELATMTRKILATGDTLRRKTGGR